MTSKSYLLLFFISSHLYANEIKNPQPIFFEKKPEIQPEFLLTSEKKNSDENIASMPLDLASCINISIVKKDWKSLDICLDQYKKEKNYDEVLYQYGLGSLYYHKGNREQAIKIYKNMINEKPDLVYPRFDLAMMLFQDKRYKEAKKELELVQGVISPRMQVLVKNLLITINESEKWQTSFNFNFERTTNVNQASNLKEITIGDAVFLRDESSLPQTAQGIGYNSTISKDKNILKNSYIHTSLMLDGIYYWDSKDYSEQTYRFDIGYKNKSFKNTWGIIPFIEKNILGNSLYNENYGLNLDLNHKISDKIQLSTNFSHIIKKYKDKEIASIYNGYSNSQVALIIYQPRVNFIIYGGIDNMQDHLKDNSESSETTGLRGGLIHTTDFLSIKANLRYAHRDFDNNNIWYKEKRKDNETDLLLTLWKKEIQWNNFIPKFNYKYQNIKSNLELYSRDNSSLFITIEKDF